MLQTDPTDNLIQQSIQKICATNTGRRNEFATYLGKILNQQKHSLNTYDSKSLAALCTPLTNTIQQSTQKLQQSSQQFTKTVMDAARIGYTSKKTTPSTQVPKHVTQLQTYTSGKSSKKHGVIMLTDNVISQKKRQAKTHVHKNSRRSYQSKRSSADQNSHHLYADKPVEKRATSTQSRRGPPKPDSRQT